MMSAVLILAVMVIPFTSAVAREVLKAVPVAQREAAYALGATQWEAIRAALFYAHTGIMGAIMLGFGRALGETMAVTMVTGNNPQISLSLFQPQYTMAAVLANEFTEAADELYLHALIEENTDLLDEVAIGDAEVNARQIAVDDRAFKLLALHQPVAVDLQVIVAAIKINSDLERVGDLAVNIAEATRRYFGIAQRIELRFIPRMADIAQTMLDSALQSFVTGSLGLAQSVLERDDALDSLRVQAYRRLVDVMASNGALVPSALELMSVARHLERIGDHATNIAEDVFFIVAGEDVRIQTLGGADVASAQP